MKKFLSILVVLTLTLSTLLACSSGSTTSDTAATDESATSTASNGGHVYYLNFKPEADNAWQTLAQAYTAETGTPVSVVTAASGNYETTLMSEMSKSSAPTLFQVNGPVGLANWVDVCYDLSNTPVYNELTSDSFALKHDNAVLGIAYVIESYGIITNKKLLAEAGYSVDDIKSFADLKRIAEDISSRSEELGFTAFTSAGLDGSSDWRFKTHLANLPIYFEYQNDKIEQSPAIKGTYLDNYRNVWDLYINNSTTDPKLLSSKTGDDSRNEFIAGQAVFFQNGSWEYNNLKDGGFADEDLAMIPIYFGVGDEASQGLCTGTENFWCVNKNAKPEDIAATLDFMNWCVTSTKGTTSMANDMGFVIPFKKAATSPNLFVRQDNEYTAAGRKPVGWCFTTMPSEEWKNGVGQGLTAYAADQNDSTWADVVSAFVDGWKTEYDLAH